MITITIIAWMSTGLIPAAVYGALWLGDRRIVNTMLRDRGMRRLLGETDLHALQRIAELIDYRATDPRNWGGY